MKKPIPVALAALTFLLIACNKPREVAPATPVPTPHPAQAAKAAAVRLYPELAKKDSNFNRAFLEIYEQRQKTHPEALAQVDWPLDVARRAGTMLGVHPQSDKVPEPEPVPPPAEPLPAPPPLPPPPKAPNPLDRGAYNERQGVSRPPVILDNRGNRVPMR